MAELKAEGSVIEVRDDLIVIRPRWSAAVTTHPNELAIEIVTRPGEVFPGDRVQIWDDGTIEIVGKSPVDSNVKRVELPSNWPQHDHS